MTDNLRPHLLQKPLIENIKIIDLTCSSDESDCDDEPITVTDDTKASEWVPIDTDSPTVTDTPIDTVTTGSISNGTDTNVHNDGEDSAFSDEKCDDSITTDDQINTIDVSSTNSLHVGQIVWAALFGYPFWPAIIFNDTESQTFRKGKFNRIFSSLFR